MALLQVPEREPDELSIDWCVLKMKANLGLHPPTKIAERSKQKLVELVGNNNDAINTLLRRYARTYLVSIQLGGGQHTHLPRVLYGLQFPSMTPKFYCP